MSGPAAEELQKEKRMRPEQHPHTGTYGGHASHGDKPAPAMHTRHDHTAPGHDRHAGHTPGMFRDRFWLSLLLTLPILYFDDHFQAWFGYQALQFPGVAWVQPLLSSVLYFYGGGVF